MSLETFLLEEYWYGEQPMKCRGCECSELEWDFEGRVFWGCDQTECYQGKYEMKKEIKQFVAIIGCILTFLSMFLLMFILTSEISLPVDGFTAFVYFIFIMPIVGGWSFDNVSKVSEFKEDPEE